MIYNRQEIIALLAAGELACYRQAAVFARTRQMLSGGGSTWPPTDKLSRGMVAKCFILVSAFVRDLGAVIERIDVRGYLN